MLPTEQQLVALILLFLVFFLVFGLISKKNFFSYVTPSLIIVCLLFFIKATENYLNINFIRFGVFPKSLDGLKGILFMPFIHSSLKHLINNAIPILILGSALKFFYREIYKEIFIWSWLISGIWLWTIGRPSFHIGASGVVYALASFLFFSGIIRKNNKLISVSLFVVFIYGGMIWGLFPIIESISWEGHVSGAIAGLFLAFWFKNDGPQKMQYYYEIEEEIEKYNDSIRNYFLTPKFELNHALSCP